MTLKDFLLESNMIEGYDFVDEREEQAGDEFLKLTMLSVQDVSNFVHITTLSHGSSGLIRTVHGMDVQIGDHFPKRGGPEVYAELRTMLETLSFVAKNGGGKKMAWQFHCQYEDLHPYTDGNGRSGRMIWLWMMGGQAYLNNSKIGFLQMFYYQTLQNSR